MGEDWKRWQGRVVDGHVLGQYLGGSDHSAVFLTERSEAPGSKFAIKLIAADPKDAEAQLSRWNWTAKLSHPHLVRLFEMGRCQLDKKQLLFVVMEYAEENLSQILPKRSLTPAEAYEMLAPTLDALSFIHRKGLVHGHLKPSNVLAVGEQLKLSSDGMCTVGSPAKKPAQPGMYDPPVSRDPALSAADDVWSLGVLICEALTQRLPVITPEQDVAAVPAQMPIPLLEVARLCLRVAPQERGSIEQIALRLSQRTPARAEHSAVHHRNSNMGYAVTAMAVVVLIAALGIPRLMRKPVKGQVAVAKLQQPAAVKAAESRFEQKPAAGKAIPSGHMRQVSTGTPATESSHAADVRTGKTPNADGQQKVVSRVVPSVPKSARDTIHGTIRVKVRVRVDPSGSVTGAKFVLRGPSKYFARLAMEAAMQWKFASEGGRDASREWMLPFEFGRNSTRVVPVEMSR